MNDKELADAVERILGFDPDDMFGGEWATDWRVAGALMDKCSDDFMLEQSNGGLSLSTRYETNQPGLFWKRGPSIENEPLPRAIIEACVAALKQEEDGDE